VETPRDDLSQSALTSTALFGRVETLSLIRPYCELLAAAELPADSIPEGLEL
jgi:hypothetical protein